MTTFLITFFGGRGDEDSIYSFEGVTLIWGLLKKNAEGDWVPKSEEVEDILISFNVIPLEFLNEVANADGSLDEDILILAQENFDKINDRLLNRGNSEYGFSVLEPWKFE